MNEVIITPLDQQIARILTSTISESDKKDCLIALLKAKQELIDQYEERFTELDAELH